LQHSLDLGHGPVNHLALLYEKAEL